MEAYASVQRLAVSEQLLTPGPTPTTPLRRASTNNASDSAPIDQLLGRLADLVVDRLMTRAGTDADQPADEWMDARTAAVYLGIHRDTLRKLAAERAVPVHVERPAG
jgi:hypothetical protein